MQKKKTKIITARMTPADKQAIHQRAKSAGMTSQTTSPPVRWERRSSEWMGWTICSLS